MDIVNAALTKMTNNRAFQSILSAIAILYQPTHKHILKQERGISSTTLPPTHTPHTHITHTPSHNTPHHSTSLHNIPSTISILPPILRGLTSNNISGGPTIALYYDSFHLHFPFQPLCLHILILTTRRLEWTGRGKPPLRVGRPWIRRRYFIPIRIDGV